jgi:hypothetical protein
MPEHARAVRTARTAPAYPRRVSGPSRRPALAGVPAHRGRTSAFEKLGRIPDHRVVDRLLRGRACILLIGLMLGGIVAMQVSLLRLNTGISRAVQTQDTLMRQNARLQAAIAESTSGEKIAAAAVALNMVEPPAGETRYLTARPEKDPDRAARRMKPPSERAQAIMLNGGMVPGILAEPGSAAAELAARLNGTATTGGTTTTTPGATPGVATTTPDAATTTTGATTTTTTPGATTTTTGAGTTTPGAATTTTPDPAITGTTTTTPGTTAAAPTATPPTTPQVTTAPGTGAATAPAG